MSRKAFYTVIGGVVDLVGGVRIHFDRNVTADPQLSFFGPSPTTSYPIDGALSRVDTAMVFVTSYSREGYDRSSLNVSK